MVYILLTECYCYLGERNFCSCYC